MRRRWQRWQRSATYIILMVLGVGVLLALLAGRPTDSRVTGVAGAPSVLLWTMMRSGSRMVQDLLTAQPCSFPVEEPLRRYIRKKDFNASISVLQDLLDCRFTARSDNLTEWVNGSYAINPPVWRLCQAFHRLCWHETFIEVLCRTSCLRLVRVVAQGLALALSFLQDRASNSHIVHLVRDPRGMISSRRDLQHGPLVMFHENKKVDHFHNDEMDVGVMCQRYRHDLAVARHLAHHYPGR